MCQEYKELSGTISNAAYAIIEASMQVKVKNGKKVSWYILYQDLQGKVFWTLKEDQNNDEFRFIECIKFFEPEQALSRLQEVFTKYQVEVFYEA